MSVFHSFRIGISNESAIEVAQMRKQTAIDDGSKENRWYDIEAVGETMGLKRVRAICRLFARWKTTLLNSWFEFVD